jgi:hypothetical protein
MTDRRPAGGDERLRELAALGAQMEHGASITHRGDWVDHVDPFETCPDPDCVLVRQPAERPAPPKLEHRGDLLAAVKAIRAAETTSDVLDVAIAQITNPLLLKVAERPADLRELIDALRRHHTYCEDCWYSCPKATEGCCDDSQGEDCNCGADEHNARVDAALDALVVRAGKEQP